VVNALGDAAGRDIARMAFVIDSDAVRCSSVNTGLKALGVSSVCWDNGAKGTAMLHRVPGVDVILVADKLSDLTTDQVIDDIRADSRYEKTPVFVLSATAEKAAELYGATTQGVIGNAADLSAVGAALGAVTGDRARADKLAAQAAMALAHLSMSGTNVSSALNGLTSTLATRPDEVTIPAMFAIGAAGDGTHIPALMSVVSDGKRSDAARAAAANAAAAIFGRGAQASAEGLAALGAVLKSDASMPVKTAVAGAVGNLRLDPEVRAELLRTARMAKTKPTE
jgi:CheY-like chemotaxis protein